MPITPLTFKRLKQIRYKNFYNITQHYTQIKNRHPEIAAQYNENIYKEQDNFFFSEEELLLVAKEYFLAERTKMKELQAENINEIKKADVNYHNNMSTTFLFVCREVYEIDIRLKSIKNYQENLDWNTKNNDLMQLTKKGLTNFAAQQNKIDKNKAISEILNKANSIEENHYEILKYIDEDNPEKLKQIIENKFDKKIFPYLIYSNQAGKINANQQSFFTYALFRHKFKIIEFLINECCNKKINKDLLSKDGLNDFIIISLNKEENINNLIYILEKYKEIPGEKSEPYEEYIKKAILKNNPSVQEDFGKHRFYQNFLSLFQKRQKEKKSEPQPNLSPIKSNPS